MLGRRHGEPSSSTATGDEFGAVLEDHVRVFHRTDSRDINDRRAVNARESGWIQLRFESADVGTNQMRFFPDV